MGEARRRRGCVAGGDSFVRIFKPGEADLTLGDIARMGKVLLGDRACLYEMTARGHRAVDPQTGQLRYVSTFVVARFLTDADKGQPEPRREQEILGQGVSWAEAFARAELALMRRRTPRVS